MIIYLPAISLTMMRLLYWIVLTSLFQVYCCSYTERVKVSTHQIKIRYRHQVKDDTHDFSQTIDTKLFNGIKATKCSFHDDEYCIKWHDRGQFRIKIIDQFCEKFQYWTTFNKKLDIQFDLTNIHLYGGSQQENQTWPIAMDGNTDSFASSEYNSKAILEPFWYTSNGFFVQVEEKVPLFVSYKANSLNLIASREAPYIRGSITHMNYKVCKYDNIKIAYKHAIADSLGKPVGPPDYKMAELPIWSTWAKYKVDINDTAVMEFANSIIKHGFPNSQLEIDDKWQTCYGSLTVDTKRFPDMKGLVDRLHSMGYRVTIWVHPFVNADCQPFFDEGVKKNYFVRRKNGTVVGEWWNGAAANVDFTNPEAVDWYTMRLQKLLDETGIDSYKFDAGETSWSPQVPILHAMMEDHPETLLKAYIQTVASFGSMVEVRSARRTQKYPIYLRMMDRETHWVGRLGLNTLIPTLLHMNIIGYPFVLPDMIGGNGYNNELATKELFTRWLQATVFMPSLQFSYPPWDYDEQVISITRKYVELHKHYAPQIFELMKRATMEETMVNAPLWWVDPTDSTALTIDSEFLLGDILVAPVLEKGAKSRDIYFPKGIWRDETIKGAPYITGPTWVKNYPASLEVLPYFTKITTSSSSILSPGLLIISISLLPLFNKFV